MQPWGNAELKTSSNAVATESILKKQKFNRTRMIREAVSLRFDAPIFHNAVHVICECQLVM